MMDRHRRRGRGGRGRVVGRLVESGLAGQTDPKMAGRRKALLALSRTMSSHIGGTGPLDRTRRQFTYRPVEERAIKTAFWDLISSPLAFLYVILALNKTNVLVYTVSCFYAIPHLVTRGDRGDAPSKVMRCPKLRKVEVKEELREL